MTEQTAAGPELDSPTWKDGKRYAWLLGTIVPGLVPAAWGLHNWTGSGVAWWFGPIFVFGVIPLLDVFFGADETNPPEELVAWLEQDRYYRLITYLFLPLQYASLTLAVWLWARGGMSVIDKVGLAFTAGAVCGIGINTAHELGHKKDDVERWLSRIALASTAYGHFYVEHNRGHHVRIATPEDHATSRFGESFWRFLPRVVKGSVVSAWNLEKVRLQRSHKRVFSIGNDVLNAWAMTLGLWAVYVAIWGFGVLPYLLIVAVYGFSLLESVNYLEHYGLLRQKVGDGTRYERVSSRHSWNNNNVVTNIFLYQLQRHSDHHANPTRRYQALRHFDESPQMPAGYAAMIVLTYFPPLWRKVMDPKVLAHYDGDITRANIQPSKREKVLARYGAAASQPGVPNAA
jgi:alkane 1-monooxygenase